MIASVGARVQPGGNSWSLLLLPRPMAVGAPSACPLPSVGFGCGRDRLRCVGSSAGKAAKRASWLSAWEAENAQSKEGLYAQALLDLAKAFQTVPHDRLWAQASARGYPLQIPQTGARCVPPPSSYRRG